MYCEKTRRRAIYYKNSKNRCLIENLTNEKNEDFGKETLLPIGSKPYIGMKTAKNKRKTKTKKKTKREHFHIRNM